MGRSELRSRGPPRHVDQPYAEERLWVFAQAASAAICLHASPTKEASTYVGDAGCGAASGCAFLWLSPRTTTLRATPST